MKLISNLKAIDAKAIEDYGIPGITLMETAGKYVANAVVNLLEGKTDAKVVVVCGGGNNAGDGFVCARQLAVEHQLEVTVLCMVAPEKLTGDAATNFERLTKTQVNVVLVKSMEAVQEAIGQAHVLVDALFGSGLTRPVEGMAATVIEAMNRQRQDHPIKTARTLRTISVDLPSGIDGGTGQVIGIAVEADITVTFACGKPGLFLMPGKAYAREVQVVDIGIPSKLIAEDPSRVLMTDLDWVRQMLPRRSGMAAMGHKYSFGHLLVVAGSRQMPGATVLVAEAAMRSGVGVVTLAAPNSVFERMAIPPEVLQCPLPESSNGTLDSSCIDMLMEKWQGCNAMAFGPGLGCAEETVGFFEAVLPRLVASEKPVVLDADGLNCLAAFSTQQKNPVTLTPYFVLTPHLGEAGRLMGKESAELQADLVAGARQLQEQLGCQVVLKSASSITATTDKCVWINPTGNAGMATAGSGDVLTGVLGGLLAQPSFDEPTAAALAPYLHGLAGDMAARVLTPYSMIARDITRYLPDAFKLLLQKGVARE